MTDNPLQATEAHIDPIIFAEALAELDWTPKAEIKQLVDIIRNETNVRHKMGAMQILRSRIIETLELSGAIQLVQARIHGRLPGGQHVTAERSRYLTSSTAASVHGHMKTLDTERQDVPAPSQTLEHPDDDDPDRRSADTTARSDSRSDSRVGQDDLANRSTGKGPGPDQPDERHPTADPGDPPEPTPEPAPDRSGGYPGHSSIPADTDETKVDEVKEVEVVEVVEEPFRPRKPEARPAFGRPLGRRTPTKPTIGGGICGSICGPSPETPV